MGWGEQLPSGRWRARYRGADGTTRRNATPGITYATEAEAIRHAAAKELEQRRPGALHPEAGRLTWGTWCERWWPRRRVADGTRTRDVSRRDHHLTPRWDAVPLDEITRDEVESWVAELAARPDLSPSTVQRIYHLFSASMRAAALARKIDVSPCASIPLERAPIPDEVFLTKDEVERVAALLGRPQRLMVWLGAYTGLRWGELVALHRQRVDLDVGRIDVVLAWDIKNRAYKTPKDYERRSVPIPQWLADELRTWFEELGPAHRCGKTHPPKLASRCTSGLVVPGRNGVPVDYDVFRRSKWAPVVGRWTWTDGTDSYDSRADALRALGVEVELERLWAEGEADVQGPVTIHDLRHTYASWLLQDGVSIEQLSKLMGHASVLTTQRYAHLAQTQWEGVRTALSRPLGPRQAHDDLRDRRTGRSATS